MAGADSTYVRHCFGGVPDWRGSVPKMRCYENIARS